ncbi:NTPase [Algoriphagus halophytocola]|uniref:NTPase n=1 Tax=Algoriphagus halophytocola TaxID=2991499 RepID=A0ABY6MGA4_9BACT|nr:MULTISPECIES: NTPase [unclassified Algoriphagus]UZD21457.1 NTPase [Algoriphagus sp. TR-M5]WBL42669.1 NTPase [Algoriphagus sp. TR-M9]
MKYLFIVLILFISSAVLRAQGTLPESFFDGKSIVFISADPSARPIMTWMEVADSVHQALTAAGGDPVAYFELEKVALSEAVQADYAQYFGTRLIKNIVLVTRQKNQSSIHVGPFTGDAKMIPSTSLYGIQAQGLEETLSQFAGIGEARETRNLLVIDVPEFLTINQEQISSQQKFLARNPLNLDVFKLGIPIAGSSAETGLLSYFRYDMYGKSPEAILAEQDAQKAGIKSILDREYPYDVEWLTEARSNQELIQDRIQFLLVKVEGREADLMKSMGVESAGAEPSQQIVVKYYIKLIVRDELYIGPEWDADPDWRVALENFLKNLKKVGLSEERP